MAPTHGMGCVREGSWIHFGLTMHRWLSLFSRPSPPLTQLSCSHTVNSLGGHARCHCACWNQIETRIVVLLRRVSFFSFLNFGAFSCVWDLNTFAKCVCSPIYALASPRNCITLSVELQFSNQQTSLGFSVADALRLDPRVPRLVLCGWYGLH